MHFGLVNDERGLRYLEQKYGLIHQDTVAGMPIFKNAEGEEFVGGFKNVYAVVLGDATALLHALERWRRGRKMVTYCFVTEQNHFESKRIAALLTIPPGTEALQRFSLYRVNARNYVHQVQKSPLRFIVEPPPQTWYELYSRSVQRLGSIPRPRAWFTELETAFAPCVRCVSAYDGACLAGALYFLHSENYLVVPFVASDTEYWPLRINNGLWDGVVRFAVEQGIPLLDFGPSMVHDKSHLHIKFSFGATPYYHADAVFCSPIRRMRVRFLRLIRRITDLLRRWRYRWCSVP